MSSRRSSSKKKSRSNARTENTSKGKKEDKLEDEKEEQSVQLNGDKQNDLDDDDFDDNDFFKWDKGELLHKSGRAMTNAEAAHFMDTEIQAVRDGTHAILLAQLKGLEEKRDEQLSFVALMKRRRTENVNMLTEAETKIVMDEFTHEKQRVETEMLEQLQLKRRKLDSKLALRIQEAGAVTRRKAGAGALVVPNDSRRLSDSRKRSRVTFHKMKFQLTPEEIAHDVGAMRVDFVAWDHYGTGLKVEDEVLWMNGHKMPLRCEVQCQQAATGRRYVGELVDLSPLELHVRRKDQIDVRIMMEQLRDKTWTVSPHPLVTETAGAADSKANGKAQRMEDE